MTVHIAENHELTVKGLQLLFQGESINIAGVTYNGEETIEWFAKNTADILLLDISMPKVNGIEVLKYFKEHDIAPKVIVLSAYNNDVIIEAVIKYGVKGYILKEEAHLTLLDALKDVYNGKTYFSKEINDRVLAIEDRIVAMDALSSREREVMSLLSKNYDYKEVTQELGISSSTLRSHTNKIRNKLGLKTNAGFAKYIVRFLTLKS
ncbi:conserved hypothetical protein [Tenacibaculum sp. 190524A02b]|uniref:DNA-binding response regulator n=1 Tax=Tenacibaculum vairaonense TaxID=3137860 RepID=A0ABP1FB47_9FLAO